MNLFTRLLIAGTAAMLAMATVSCKVEQDAANVDVATEADMDVDLVNLVRSSYQSVAMYNLNN